MDNDRTRAWPPFDRVDAPDSLGVQRVRPQAVNGFGGESHQASGAEKPRATSDFTGIDGLGHPLIVEAVSANSIGRGAIYYGTASMASSDRWLSFPRTSTAETE